MSHRATNWAVTVRGISPHAKVVLWHLADRHNGDTERCDPSQARLADDCEMSRSGLNRQLNLLEEKGFISRVQRVSAETGRQKSTSYILHFDVVRPQDGGGRVHEMDTESVSTEEGGPCPSGALSRVHEVDTNPVREPGKNLTRASAREDSDSEDLGKSDPDPPSAETEGTSPRARSVPESDAEDIARSKPKKERERDAAEKTRSIGLSLNYANGDRSKLNEEELEVLDGVLKRAREWAEGDNPYFARLGRETLAKWPEPREIRNPYGGDQ